MSRTVKSAIFYSAIGIAVVVGIMFFIVYNETLGTMFFQRTADEEENDGNSDSLGGSVPTLGYLTYYKSILAVGEEGRFDTFPKFGEAPYTFEWKFSDGLTLTGQNFTRSFDSPGRYFFNLTITDGTGDKVTSSQLHTDVVQEIANKEGVAANATSSTQHN
jgi:hypothetical protein